MTIKTAAFKNDGGGKGHENGVREVDKNLANLPRFQRNSRGQNDHPKPVSEEHGAKSEDSVDDLKRDARVSMVTEKHNYVQIAHPWSFRQERGRVRMRSVARVVGPPAARARSEARPCQETARRAAS